MGVLKFLLKFVKIRYFLVTGEIVGVLKFDE